MIDVTTSVEIERPVREVFAFVADQTNAPQWQTGLHEVRRLTDGPIGVGSEHEFVRTFAGRRFSSRNRFVAFEPGRYVRFEIPSGWITGAASCRTEVSQSAGTVLTSRMEFRVRPHRGGCDVVTVQQALGHSSATITLGVYSHLWPNAEDRSRAAAGGLMAPRCGHLRTPCGPSRERPLSGGNAWSAVVGELQREVVVLRLHQRAAPPGGRRASCVDTRSSSPWICALTPLGPSSRISLAIFLASSDAMPSLRVIDLGLLAGLARLGGVEDLQALAALDQLLLEDVEDGAWRGRRPRR